MGKKIEIKRFNMGEYKISTEKISSSSKSSTNQKLNSIFD
jgi:hypothetical protein